MSSWEDRATATFNTHRKFREVWTGIFETTERELAKTLLYTQTATRRAQGINVESVPPTSVQSTAEQASTLNVQQKMKQFDAVRREQQQEQVEKESRRKREAAPRKSHLDAAEAAQRLQRLDEQRATLEERQRERTRREVEQMEEMEREKSRLAAEQARRLAEAMEREQREREAEREAERLGREMDERRKTRCRLETEALLTSQNRRYYEGGTNDWPHELSREEAACGDKPPALDTSGDRKDGRGCTPVMPGGDNESRPPPVCLTSPAGKTAAADAKPRDGRSQSHRRLKSLVEKHTSQPATSAGAGECLRVSRELAENLNDDDVDGCC